MSSRQNDVEHERAQREEDDTADDESGLEPHPDKPSPSDEGRLVDCAGLVPG